jgi:predicted NACHT family NTPase
MDGNPRLAELAVNPMLLSLIVLVQYVRRVIPDRRHILYDECIKILVERRYAPPMVQAEYNRVLPGEEAIRILRDLAYVFHERRLREVSRRILVDQDIPKVLSSMRLSRAAAVSAVEILQNIEARSQLLVERGLDANGEPVMAFSHLTFQEYLSSIYLKELITTSSEPFVSQQLIVEYEKDSEWWEEVALLYAAQLEGQQQESFIKRLRET